MYVGVYFSRILKQRVVNKSSHNLSVVILYLYGFRCFF